MPAASHSNRFALAVRAIAAAVLLCHGPSRALGTASVPDGSEALTRTFVSKPTANENALTIVHFFATWCAPCLPEIETLAAFHDEVYPALARRGALLQVVSNDVRKRDLDAFLSERPLPFDVVLDTLWERSASLGLHALPATVVLDADGIELARYIGPQDWGSPEFVAEIATHLGKELQEELP